MIKPKLGKVAGLLILMLIMILSTPYIGYQYWFVNASPEWFADGWQYRENITLSSPTPEVNFQVMVSFNTNVIDYSLFKDNGDDIRFYTLDGSPCSYWIQDWNTQGTSNIWVKVPIKNTKSLQMYYGNNSADVISSGQETFLFFDDFEGETDKWVLLEGSMTTEQQWDDKALKLYTNNRYARIKIKSDSFSDDIVVEYEFMYPTVPDHWKAHCFNFRANDSHWSTSQRFWCAISDQSDMSWDAGLSGFPYSMTWSNYVNDVNCIKLVRDGSGRVDAYLNGTWRTYATYNIGSPVNNLGFTVPDDSNGHYFDNFRVRKYSADDVTGTVDTENDKLSPSQAIWVTSIIFSVIGFANVVIFYVIRPSRKLSGHNDGKRDQVTLLSL